MKLKYISQFLLFTVIFITNLIVFAFLNQNTKYTCFLTTSNYSVVKKINIFEFQQFKGVETIYNAKIEGSISEIELYKKIINKKLINDEIYKFVCKKNRLDYTEIILISLILSFFICFELYLFRYK